MGVDFDLSSLKGKKVLIVNTMLNVDSLPNTGAGKFISKNNSPGQKFTIIGFHAINLEDKNQDQAPEIHDFVQKNHGVTFKGMEKVNVKRRQYL